MSSFNNDLEIERKFLVKSLPTHLADFPRKTIQQGYLPSLRVRKIDNAYKITFKRWKGIVRSEFEFDITLNEFILLWLGTEGAQIEKIRYYIEEGIHTYELDKYGGDLSGLYTVEVEFDSLESANAFTSPEWFGQEVTDDERYTNGSLSRNGLPA